MDSRLNLRADDGGLGHWSAGQLAQRIAKDRHRADTSTFVVGICGPPAAGKGTLAAAMGDAIGAAGGWRHQEHAKAELRRRGLGLFRSPTEPPRSAETTAQASIEP